MAERKNKSLEENVNNGQFVLEVRAEGWVAGHPDAPIVERHIAYRIGDSMYAIKDEYQQCVDIDRDEYEKRYSYNVYKNSGQQIGCVDVFGDGEYVFVAKHLTALSTTQCMAMAKFINSVRDSSVDCEDIKKLSQKIEELLGDKPLTFENIARSLKKRNTKVYTALKLLKQQSKVEIYYSGNKKMGWVAPKRG